MDKEYTTIEALIADESFQNHILRSDAAASKFWLEWESGRPDRQQLVKEATELLRQLSMQPSDEEVIDAHEELKRNMRTMKNKVSPVSQRTSNYSIHKKSNVAASSSASSASTKSFTNSSTRSSTSSSTNSSSESSSDFPMLNVWTPIIFTTMALVIGAILYFQVRATEQLEMTNVSTGYGEILTRRLADGSTVTLNGNSKLSIQELSDNYSRRMILNGEAFFEISSTPLVGEQKCEVITSEGTISVLGASFNVRDRGDDFEMILTNGQVGFIQRDAANMELIPGEFISKVGDGIMEKSKVNPAMYLAWKNHHMVFEDVSIDRVVNRLKQDFGIEMTVLDEMLKKKTINVNIKNDDPKFLLEELANIHGVQLRQKGTNKYILE